MSLTISQDHRSEAHGIYRWRETQSDGQMPECSARAGATAASVAHASIGLVHGVPAPLRHIGCMWLEDGDEHQRCCRPPAWTMGLSLALPRLYCEKHGHIIHMLAEQRRARRRRRAD